MKKIRLIIMDVDGTLTDGKIYINNEKEIFKVFNVKDGMIISQLDNYNMVPILITGRTSDIVNIRAKEIKINEIYQGVKNKKDVLYDIMKKYNIEKTEIAYIGDDINDVECLCECGISGCPNDAIDSVKKICDFISAYKGGDGAVREFIDFIIQYNNKL